MNRRSHTNGFYAGQANRQIADPAVQDQRILPGHTSKKGESWNL